MVTKMPILVWAGVSTAYILSQMCAPLWPLALLFPALFIYALARYPLMLWQAVLWALVTWSPHYIALVGFGFALSAHFCNAAIISLTGVAIITQAFIFVGVMRLRAIMSPAWPIATAGISLFLLLWVTHNFYLLLLGRIEGNPLFTPLNALAACPFLIMPAAFVGIVGLMGLYVLWGMAGASVWAYRDAQSIGFLGIISLVWALLAQYAPLPEMQELSRPIGLCKQQIICLGGKAPDTLVQQVCARIASAVAQEGPLSLVVLPESAIAGNVEIPAIQPDIPIIMGVYRAQDGKSYNTAICFDGTQQYVVDKRHTVAIAESYYKDAGAYTFPRWELSTGITVLPLICSELYLSSIWKHIPRGTFVIGLCNDLWAPRYIARLCLYAARLHAIAHRCPIFFASRQFHEAIWFAGDRKLVPHDTIVLIQNLETNRSS